MINGADCSEGVRVQRTSCPDSQQEYPEDNYLMKEGRFSFHFLGGKIGLAEPAAWSRRLSALHPARRLSFSILVRRAFLGQVS